MRYSFRFSLGSITFFIFINDLKHVKKFLDPIMLADDINLFYSNNNINENVNKKVIINITETIIFFHKQTDRNNILLKLPDLKFTNIILKRVSELKFLVAMIDRSLN